jgi:hypothetical protein
MAIPEQRQSCARCFIMLVIQQSPGVHNVKERRDARLNEQL